MKLLRLYLGISGVLLLMTIPYTAMLTARCYETSSYFQLRISKLAEENSPDANQVELMGMYLKSFSEFAIRGYDAVGNVSLLSGIAGIIQIILAFTLSTKKKEPNQSLQTTTMAVTPAASHPSRHP